MPTFYYYNKSWIFILLKIDYENIMVEDSLSLVLAFFALVLAFFAFLFVSGHRNSHGQRQYPQRHIQHPQGHRRGPQQPNIEVRMPNIPLVSPIVQTCRTCGVYLNIAVTTLKLNILLSTINRFETEVARVQQQNFPGRVQTVQFLRDEIDSLTRKRVALYNRLVALELSL
jgi:hypothetical protein